MRTPISFLIICVLVLIAASCKSDSSGNQQELAIIKTIEQDIAADPSRENVSKSLLSLSESIVATKDPELKKKLLTSGYEIARANDQTSQAISYLVPLIRDYDQGTNIANYLYYIGEHMVKTKNRLAGEVILQGFIDQFPTDSRVEKAKKMILSDLSNRESFIQQLAESVFVNPDQFGINRLNAQKYVDVCEAHALVYPDDPATPLYLYRAGEIAVAIRTFTKALSLYDWLIDQYPSFEKTPNALFAKGYLLDEELNKQDKAKEAYNQFVEDYPNHELADDAKFLLENLGKSGDEIIEMIEAKNKEKQAQ